LRVISDRVLKRNNRSPEKIVNYGTPIICRPFFLYVISNKIKERPYMLHAVEREEQVHKNYSKSLKGKAILET
jgi:hypothetical protein